MYATAIRVIDGAGKTGINSFLHNHGQLAPWPAESWRLPETDPGKLVRQHIEVDPGGNRVRSYLDVLAPDDATSAELDVALTGLWLELVADESGPVPSTGPLPNPVVYQRGRVVLRFGVEDGLMSGRALEMTELRDRMDPASSPWSTAAK